MTLSLPPRAHLILAQGCGDALGTQTEFLEPHEAQALIPGYEDGALPPLAGGGPFGFAPGEVEGDTQMTLCALRALALWDGRELGALAVAGFSPPDIGLSTARLVRQCALERPGN